jgi:negative regulator of flagellin synthesis FlgM
LQKLSSVLASTPVVNSVKVASIKQAVQSGSYAVNAGSVADKLLQFDGELK